jgi:hypothetical protein
LGLYSGKASLTQKIRAKIGKGQGALPSALWRKVLGVRDQAGQRLKAGICLVCLVKSEEASMSSDGRARWWGARWYGLVTLAFT